MFQILLKGANGDDLKKVKHVIQYGVFAAYHLALETSFLADEGASLPELPLKSPITVALPDKPSSIERSISTIPGFMVPGGPANGKPSCPESETTSELKKSSEKLNPDKASTLDSNSVSRLEKSNLEFSHQGRSLHSTSLKSSLRSTEASEWHNSQTYMKSFAEKVSPEEHVDSTTANPVVTMDGSHLGISHSGTSWASVEDGGDNALVTTCQDTTELSSSKQENINKIDGMGSSKEDFPPSTSDHQSILVSLSTRCVWKGTVCERAHLFRIKYYGSFDKPLGRYLRDQLFDEVVFIQSSSCLL